LKFVKKKFNSKTKAIQNSTKFVLANLDKKIEKSSINIGEEIRQGLETSSQHLSLFGVEQIKVYREVFKEEIYFLKVSSIFCTLSLIVIAFCYLFQFEIMQSFLHFIVSNFKFFLAVIFAFIISYCVNQWASMVTQTKTEMNSESVDFNNPFNSPKVYSIVFN
jgi:hypothetical protein